MESTWSVVPMRSSLSLTNTAPFQTHIKNSTRCFMKYQEIITVRQLFSITFINVKQNAARHSSLCCFKLPIFPQTDNLLALMLEYALTLQNVAALVSKINLGQISHSTDFIACLRKAFIYGNTEHFMKRLIVAVKDLELHLLVSHRLRG